MSENMNNEIRLENENIDNEMESPALSKDENVEVLNIKDDDVWTYKIEGLSAPRINKPVKNRLLKQIVFVLIIVVAVGLAIYFSVAAVQKDTFEFKEVDSGVELTKFNNTGYIKELYVDYYTDINY